MKEIKKDVDSWGDLVIYVGKCTKYEHEKQMDLHNSKNKRLYDIMYLVENYYNNNWGNRYENK